MRLKHPIPSEVLRARIEFAGDPPLTITRRVRIHAINDCLMGARFSNKWIDASYLGAAFVNENNPELPARVIRYALDHHIDRFVGYEGGAETVAKEVEAIYRSMQDMGFKYAAMLRSSVGSEKESRAVNSQWIRLSSDSIRSEQANCIDGTVILAAVLTRLRLRVVLFILPYEHAFMGVWRSPDDRTLASVLAIETTRLGSADFAVATSEGHSSLARYVKDLAQARSEGVRPLSDLKPSDLAELRSKDGLDRSKFIDLPKLYVVDIQDARLHRGIQPVAELMPGSRWVIPLPSVPR
jgi:hypothetical protein